LLTEVNPTDLLRTDSRRAGFLVLSWTRVVYLTGQTVSFRIKGVDPTGRFDAVPAAWRDSIAG